MCRGGNPVKSPAIDAKRPAADLLSKLSPGTNDALSYTGIKPTVCSALHSMAGLHREAPQLGIVSWRSRISLLPN